MSFEAVDISGVPPRAARAPDRFDTEQFFGSETGLFAIELGPDKANDQTLLELASQLRSEQRRVLGHIQIKGAAQGACHCREMHLVDLASGLLTRISENRGREARGCHLNWAALTDVAHCVEGNLCSATDILIVNRFGRAEAEGKGMRGVIEKALSMGIPVIVGVRPAYAEVWQAFHCGLARLVAFDRAD